MGAANSIATVTVHVGDNEILAGTAPCRVVIHSVLGAPVGTIHMHEVAGLLREIADYVDVMMDVEDSL